LTTLDREIGHEATAAWVSGICVGVGESEGAIRETSGDSVGFNDCTEALETCGAVFCDFFSGVDIPESNSPIPQHPNNNNPNRNVPNHRKIGNLAKYFLVSIQFTVIHRQE
jgi:hypothetical protein